MKGSAAKKLVSIGLQHHLVMAVFIILLAAVYTAGLPVATNNQIDGATESGNPSVLFDTDKWSRSIRSSLVPSQPKLVNCRQHKCVALTFDDGPDPTHTPQVLDALKAQAAPVTFFVLGSKIADNSALVQRIHNEGHEIGNHSWSHTSFTKLKPEHMQPELDQTNQALINAGVPAAKLFRPPYGAINHKVTDTIKAPIILWNTDPYDWLGHAHATAALGGIPNSVRSGDIVVMHDTQKGTAEALPEMIKQLRQAGYKLVTVSQLLELSPASQGVYYSR